MKKANSDLIDSIGESLATFVAIVALLIMVIVLIEVIARKVFNAPTNWANPISVLIFGGYFVLGGAYTMLKEAHVRMDVVYNKLTRRTQAILNLVSSGLLFLFCGVLIFESIPYCIEATRIKQTIPNATMFSIQSWPVTWTLPITTILIVILGARQVVGDVKSLLKGKGNNDE